MEPRKTPDGPSNPRRNKAEWGGGGITLPAVQLHYRPWLSKHQGTGIDGHTDQLIGIAQKSVLAYVVNCPTTKEAGYTAGKDSLFITWCWENWTHAKKKKGKRTTFLQRTQK